MQLDELKSLIKTMECSTDSNSMIDELDHRILQADEIDSIYAIISRFQQDEIFKGFYDFYNFKKF